MATLLSEAEGKDAAARILAAVEYALAGGRGVGTLGRPVSIERILERHGFGSIERPEFVGAVGMVFDTRDLAAVAIGSGPGAISGVVFTATFGSGTWAAARWASARILYEYLNRDAAAPKDWIITDPGEGTEAATFARELFLPATEIARAYRTLRADGAGETKAVESLAECYCESAGDIAERVAELELT